MRASRSATPAASTSYPSWPVSRATSPASDGRAMRVAASISSPTRVDARVRGDGLPLPLSPHEGVGEPDHHVVRRASDFADAMRASGHDRRVTIHPRPDVVDLETENPVHAPLEHVAEHGGAVRPAAIGTGTRPLRGDD